MKTMKRGRGFRGRQGAAGSDGRWVGRAGVLLEGGMLSTNGRIAASKEANNFADREAGVYALVRKKGGQEQNVVKNAKLPFGFTKPRKRNYK